MARYKRIDTIIKLTWATVLVLGFLWLNVTLVTQLTGTWGYSSEPDAGARALVELDRGWYDGCYDADTCQFVVAGYDTIRVRLARIDAPEVSGPCPTLALRARAYLLRQLTSATSLALVPSHIDPYDRLVAEVLIDGQNTSDLLMRQGLAIRYGIRHRLQCYERRY